MKLFLSAALFVSAALLVTPDVVAQQSVVQQQTQKITHRTLTVETVYPYTIAQLEPPMVLKQTPMRSMSYETPESAISAHFSAMVAEDFEGFLASWTEASRAMMRQREAQLGRRPDYWIQQWRKVYIGKRIQLTNRIDFGRYVLFEYLVYADDASKATFRDTVALVKEGNTWKLTQELSRNPILMHWNNPGGRVQIAPDVLLNK